SSLHPHFVFLEFRRITEGVQCYEENTQGGFVALATGPEAGMPLQLALPARLRMLALVPYKYAESILGWKVVLVTDDFATKSRFDNHQSASTPFQFFETLICDIKHSVISLSSRFMIITGWMMWPSPEPYRYFTSITSPFTTLTRPISEQPEMR